MLRKEPDLAVVGRPKLEGDAVDADEPWVWQGSGRHPTGSAPTRPESSNRADAEAHATGSRAGSRAVGAGRSTTTPPNDSSRRPSPASRRAYGGAVMTASSRLARSAAQEPVRQAIPYPGHEAHRRSGGPRRAARHHPLGCVHIARCLDRARGVRRARRIRLPGSVRPAGRIAIREPLQLLIGRAVRQEPAY